MFRSWTSLVEDEVSDGIDWTTTLSAYQSVNDRSAFVYVLFASGETDFEVQPRDYGFELRYRRSVLREWFFVELLTSISWPRELLEETRERNLGFGIEFEMQFGEWPSQRQR